ncbi:phage tail protein [Agrobacterium tumefaciens]|uniref:phage tail protein n=1 Tax=Agrobacterium tumefaciens TaxID=358 RepID=UPI0021CE1F9E|nr:phage tail protein [Agrobacterium tumefaciens]
MSDIMNSMWEPLDDANVHPSPDGVAKEDAPNTVPEVIRAIKGGVKRDVLLRNPTYTSSGGGNAYVLTYPKAPETYYPGQYWFVADKTNTGPVTININGLGNRDILSAGGAPLEAGQIVAGQAVCLAYLGTAFRMQFAHSNPTFTGNLTAATFTGNGAALTALNATALATGTVNNARLPATMTGKTFSSTVTISAGGIDVTGDTAIAGTTAITGNATVSGSLTQGGNRVLTVADVGAGKSLDADLLDGQHGTYYLARANGTGTQAISTVSGLQAAIDAIHNALAINTPAGSITIWATETAPAGWLICNGAAVSRTTYAGLFAVLGGYYGTGDGSTTFNIPDLRGLFVRGKDNGRGLDPNRTLGSYQDSDNKWHGHGVNDPGHSHGGVQNGQASTGRSTAIDQPPAVYSFGSTWGATTGISIQGSGGNESRPRNIAMNYIIKT